jgi:iron complex outermembrane receptor protein
MNIRSWLAMAAALVPFAVNAEDQPAPASEGGLEEIVVTAQKRTESLVNVPISVATLSADNLQRSGITDAGSLAQVVPGLHVDSSGAFFMPSIRGVGTAVAGPGAGANVATYIDGIYKPNSLANDFTFIDVDSVQVLKGPQGTLFGRNTTGGAIVVTTRQPTFEPVLDARLGYGNYNTTRGSVFASTGLTSNLAGSLAVGAGKSSGWTTNKATGRDGNPSDDYTLRGKLLLTASDIWKITLTLEEQFVNDPSLYAVNSYKGWAGTALFGVPLITSGAHQIELSTPIKHIYRERGFSLKNEVDLDFATLASYSAGHWDTGEEETSETASVFPANGTLPIPTAVPPSVVLTQADWHYTEKTLSQEFDLGQSGKGPLDWVTGLYYYYDNTRYAPFNTALYGPFGPGGPFTGGAYPWPASSYVNTGDQHSFNATGISTTAAIFGDVTYNLDKWHFTAGGRGTYDRAGVNFAAFPSIAGGVTSETVYPSAHTHWYSFTPRAIIRYSLTDDSNVYFSFNRGSKSGLYNATGYQGQRSPVDPEKINAYEVGYKIAQHNWRLEASAFHYDYSGLQVASYVGAVAVLQNAASSKISGADLHFQQALQEHLNLDLGAAYTHARYSTFENASTSIFDPTRGVVNRPGDVSGGRMERTPTFTGTAGLTYTYPVLGGSLSVGGNYSYQTASSFDFAYTLVQPSYGLLNARVAWTDPSAHWTVSVSGKNVTNKVYLVQVLPNGGGFGQTYGEPASVFAELNVHF